jgi:hypothetical protein
MSDTHISLTIVLLASALLGIALATLEQLR